jgi:type IV secretory pathway VirB9-like protein
MNEEESGEGRRVQETSKRQKYRPGSLEANLRASEDNWPEEVGIRRAGASRKIRAREVLVGLLVGTATFAAEPSTKPRTVSASEIFNVNCALYYSTIVELPKGEDLKKVSAGDKKLFAIDWEGQYIFVKPSTDVPGRFTNVNAVAASGNVYSFTVREVSANKNAVSDLKVIVEQNDSDAINNIQHPQFERSDLRSAQLEELRKSLAQKSDELAQVKRNATLQAVKDQHHEYTWKRGKESDQFGLKAIWNNGKQTFIEADSQNAPALYEVRDGRDSLVNYTLENGKYVVDHVMEKGEMRAGKTKLEFRREKESV